MARNLRHNRARKGQNGRTGTPSRDDKESKEGHANQCSPSAEAGQERQAPCRGPRPDSLDAVRPGNGPDGTAALGRISSCPARSPIRSAMKLSSFCRGEFSMGSPNSDELAERQGKAATPGRVTQPYFLGATEVTRGDFAKFISETGYKTDADARGRLGLEKATTSSLNVVARTGRSPDSIRMILDPVVDVSWNDATAFCDWLSKKEGQTQPSPDRGGMENAGRAGMMTHDLAGDRRGHARRRQWPRREVSRTF